jgi:nucleoside-diphosphate-sugar epimerase
MMPFTLPPGNGKKVCVGGGAGFIGSHIAKRLKEAGYKVTVVDWKKNEFMEIDEFCDEVSTTVTCFPTNVACLAFQLNGLSPN